MRILICEDDPLQQDWLTCRLSDEGHCVQMTEQGDRALTAWQSGRPWDFVITDYLFIPDAKIKNGLDLVREIRLVDRDQLLILQTGESDLVLPPYVTLLRKPYTFQRLVRAMKGMQSIKPFPCSDP